MDDVPDLHRFLASLAAAPGASVKVSTLWEHYRARLTPQQRRGVKRRTFVNAIRGAGLLGIDRYGAQVLGGYSLDPLPVLLVSAKTGRLVRA